MKLMREPLIIAALAGFALAAPACAQPAEWERPGMGPMVPPPDDYGPIYAGRDPREGKIETSTFTARSPSVSALGHGPIVVAPEGAGVGSSPEDVAYEAALVDQLAKAGYQTDAQPKAGGQTIEFVVSHIVVEPPEPPHSPVSGEMAVEGGRRGTGVGLAIGIDLSKPLRALLATRLEARIRDLATHELLWQGRAEVVTREGDRRWSDQAIAARLSAALFKGFPRPI